MTQRRGKSGGAKKRPTRYADAPSTSAGLALALRHHRHGEHALAIELYEREVVADASSLDAWMNLGSAAAHLGRAKQAAQAFERALSLAPRSDRVARDAGIGFAIIGELARAKQALSRAVELNPMSIGARLMLARLCLDMGARREAVDHARIAVAHAPNDASAHLELHRVLFDDEAPAESILAAENACAADADHGLAHWYLAAALSHARRYEAAEQIMAAQSHRIDEGLRDALDYVHSQHAQHPRAFSSKRETLHFALDSCRVPGALLELGVRHGISTRWIAEKIAAEQTLHAFDSFEGLPEPWADRDTGAFSTAGEVPAFSPNVRVHAGWFEETLPRWLSEHSDRARLIHVDSDLYSSAKTALKHLAPRIGDGTVIVFDEYIGNHHWRQDEFRAFAEACEEHAWRYRYLALCWITGQAVVRIGSV